MRQTRTAGAGASSGAASVKLSARIGQACCSSWGGKAMVAAASRQYVQADRASPLGLLRGSRSFEPDATSAVPIDVQTTTQCEPSTCAIRAAAGTKAESSNTQMDTQVFQRVRSDRIVMLKV